MDRERFDALTRLFSTTGSRRGALAALFSGLLLVPDAGPLLAGGKKKRKGKRKRKGRRRSGKVVVCLSGETQHVSPSAVRGVLLAGGTRGACPKSAGKPQDERPPQSGGGGGGGGDGQACNIDDDCPDPQVCRDRRCGRVCRSNFCEAGSRRPDCCGGRCTDLQNDPNNCGSCGNRCGNNETCFEGSCRTCDVCANGCGATTVQDAVDRAASGSTVVLCPGEYQETVFIEKSLTLLGSDVSGPVKLVGTAPGTASDAVLTIGARINVVVRNIEITRGQSSGRIGGGVSNFGTLRMEQVKIHDCENIGLGGGGILNLGGSARLVLVDSEVSSNTGRDGAGIHNDGGAVELHRSNVFENTAIVQGGGIYSHSGGVLRIEDDSRIAGNTAAFGGGISSDKGTATIVDSTVNLNRAVKVGIGGGWGGGINNRESRLVLTGRTHIEDNTAEDGPGSGGGVYNDFFASLEIDGQARITGNTPDDCVNVSDSTGCPQ